MDDWDTDATQNSPLTNWMQRRANTRGPLKYFWNTIFGVLGLGYGIVLGVIVALFIVAIGAFLSIFSS